MTRISPTLLAKDSQICCSACGHALSHVGTAWKALSEVTQTPMYSFPGAGLGLDREMVMRQFACPGCLALLDTESALANDPFLDDIVRV